MENDWKQDKNNETKGKNIDYKDSKTVVIINEKSFELEDVHVQSFPSKDQSIEGSSLGSEIEYENFHFKSMDNHQEQLGAICKNEQVGDENGKRDESGKIENRNKEDENGNNYQVVLVSDKDLIAEEFDDSLKVVENVICKKLSEENDEMKDVLESRNQDLEDISDRYLCHICGKAYKQPSHLSRHTKSAHGKDDFHQCNFCNMTFTRSESLIRHLKLHEQRKGRAMPTKGPYHCPLCSKTYQQAYNVSRHLLTHSGVKPFQCPECNKTFTQHTGLSRHLVLHRGSRDFKCDVCGKAFARQFVLTRHKLTHTEDKPYKCFVCSRSFIRASQLEVHINCHKKASRSDSHNTTNE